VRAIILWRREKKIMRRKDLPGWIKKGFFKGKMPFRYD
jgi:hypothetical protein